MQKIVIMKNLFLTLFLTSMISIKVFSQTQHIYEHDFPQINSVDPKVEAMLEQLDQDEIMNYVEHLTSYRNRRADGPYIYNVKDWLVSQYNSFGLDSIYLHNFEVIPFWTTEPRPFTTAPNVLAIQPGKTHPEEIVICGAHFDSTVRLEEPYDVDTVYSPGADDNASGVAGILATARILSNYEFKRTIIYANWNAEEWGLCGSSEYAKQCAADSLDIVAYFNLDMTGYLYPGDDIHIHLLYSNCDSLLGTFVKQIGKQYLPDVKLTHAWLSGGADTDYSSFNRNGYQAISPSEDVNHMSPFIHSAYDIIGLSVNSQDQMEVFTKLNLASVALAAGFMEESVNENFADNIYIYPNPADDYIKIDGDYERFEIFDCFGRKIFYGNLSTNIDKIYVNNWQSGVYIIFVHTTDGRVSASKFFVKY